MTDRGSSALTQSDDTFEVGPSSFHWDGTSLTIAVNERSVPHLDRVRGTIKVHPKAVTDVEVSLHKTDRHIWRPFAPVADIEVDLGRAGWNWHGHGYFDANFGTAALEDDFSYWTWGRYPMPDGTACFYDATRRDGSPDLAVALKFDAMGQIQQFEAPPKQEMQRSLWTVRRETRGDAGTHPVQVKSMLDAPFYCRSVVQTTINGLRSEGVHEALDLNRFGSRWIKPMLAVKVPRRARWAT
ncbi:acyclic carotenoid 1,2-hydratase [Litoreibacter roseus]|uniref:Acyclic carotenoid 1,2-hydratase n=2 Tax=Litoreibacter roseus TaxID=2601869 RepID=A0A6N6JF76_9RHOB|nr:acyclic carotenoid 1,2-hydratase [Litoreibacter roseus]